MNTLIRSKAFWTALISFVGVVVMRYLSIPEEIWQSFVFLALTIVGLFAVDDFEKNFEATMERTIAELHRLTKK